MVILTQYTNCVNDFRRHCCICLKKSQKSIDKTEVRAYNNFIQKPMSKSSSYKESLQRAAGGGMRQYTLLVNGLARAA